MSRSAENAPQLYVGVGASAGGLEAFKSFLAALPNNTGMTFVFVQHLSPDHDSVLVELLARVTDIPIQPIEHGRVLDRDHVYVIQPDTEVTVTEGRFHVQRASARDGMRMPIDRLFTSLAAMGATAVGMILSGTGHDGREGLRAIQAAGGLTVAQDPETARHSGMPDQAIDHGVVDMILPIADMPAALARFADIQRAESDAPASPDPESGEPTSPAGLNADLVDELAEILSDTFEADPRIFKRSTLKRRLTRRMLLTGTPSLDAYLDRLRDDSKERKDLSSDLLIGVTEFFRGLQAFQQLRNHVFTSPQHPFTGDQPFRCWVAGCATGEEAYSIAIEFLDVFDSAGSVPPLQLFATDVDSQAVAVARAGIYSADAVHGHVSSRRLARYFDPLPGRGYRVRPLLRDCISFAVHDLTRDPPFSRMDLVSCRNVLIYLRSEVHDTLLQDLHFALVPGGHLWLGASENIGRHASAFDTLSASARIYRKRTTSGTARTSVQQRRHPRRPPRYLERPVRPTRASQPTPDLTQIAMAHAMPPTMIVGADDAICFIRGDVSRFVRLPEGENLSLELAATLVPAVAGSVQSVLRRARAQRTTITTTVTLEPPVRIVGRPAAELEPGSVVISFTEVEDRSAPPPSVDSSTAETLVYELEAELAHTRTELRTTVEDLEAVNEELRAANEESQSMNEELQSANEELEATTEELRSLNQELTTVNTELHEKIVLLQQANDDLDNVFNSANVPMLIFDSSLVLVRFTAAAGRLLALDHADEGRALSVLRHDVLGHDLAREADAVMRTGEPIRRQLQLDDGTSFRRRVLPYISQQRSVSGVVVTLVEITELVDVIARLHESDERLLLARRAAGLGMYDYDPRTHHIKWDEMLHKLWGYSLDTDITYERFLACLHPDDIAHTNAAVAASFHPAGNGRYTAEYRVTSRIDGETRWVHADGQAYFEDGEAVRLIGMVRDITDERAALQAQTLLATIVDGSEDAILSKDLDGTILSWNLGAEKIFGYTAKEMVGRPIFELIPEQLHDQERALLADVADGKARSLVGAERVAKDGRRLYIDVTVTPLCDPDGRIFGASKVARDISDRLRLENQLREAQERMRLAVEASQVGIFDLDVEADRNRWSPQLRAIFGLPDDADVNVRPSELGLYHPDDRQRALDALAAWVQPDATDERSNEEEFRIVRADNGETRWLMVRAITHFAGTGDDRRAIRIVGSAMDITERKLGELALKESEQRMRRMFDQAPALIAIHEGPEHVYSYSNPLHYRAVGSRKLVGLPLREAMPELMAQGIYERFDRVFRTGQAERYPVFAATFDRDGTGRAETGYFSQLLQPVFGPDGRVAGVMSFAFDVTRLVQLRAQVDESERRFRALADNIDQLVWMADGDGDIFWFNQRWFDYTGATLERVKGKNWRLYHHPDHVNRVMAGMDSAISSGQRWEDEFPLRDAAGKYRWFLSRAMPVHDDDGQVVRWFGTHTDVTEHRKAESRLRLADRRKDMFLAMLGHELRNPLSAIVNATHLLEGDLDRTRMRKVTSILSRQTKHMTRLVDGLLEVARITRGKLDIDVADVELRELVDVALNDLQVKTEQRNLTLERHLPDGPVWVRGDSVRLTQVIGNLLSNALKFTEPPGTISVYLETKEATAVFVVRDTGVGISQSLLEQIFEPFQQGNQDLARSSGGLGLGLALARGLVELHGGRLTATSAGIDAGSEFRVELPLASPNSAPAQPSSTLQGPARTVMIIEDNVDYAATMSDILTLWGHTVREFHTAGEAIDSLREDMVDAILCDLGLPDITGFEAAEQIRQLPGGENVTLVAVTGYGQAADRARTKEHFDHHFVKPVDMQELKSLLRHLRAFPVP